ncbi:MAG: ferredoxin [Acidobacteriota bacterium]|nr:MAG: ferredoxin [Acidobacteriota bacterium]
MADKDLRSEENVEGKFYVDQNCIAAKYCLSVAPENFRIDESGGYAYVCKQPETPEEEEAVRDAVNGCPVSAIGDDGE